MEVSGPEKQANEKGPEAAAFFMTLHIGVYRIWFASRLVLGNEKTAPKLI